MSVHIINADCRDALAEMDENSVDACVTDPPYGLSFMGRAWDKGVPGVEFWAEVFRVLKPGGHLLTFGGTSTYHRMAVAVEDAGFEIRDCIAWVYGSGFPKSQNVSKAIDKAAGKSGETTPTGAPVKRMIPGADQDKTGSWIKDNGREYQPGEYSAATDQAAQWDGWGTALKPAMEPIVVARKPLIGTVAANVLAHGTGAINIEKSRVGGDEHGRWPANLIHDGSDEVLAAFRDAGGQLARESTSNTPSAGQNVYGDMRRGSGGKPPRNNGGSAARFFYCAKASKADRDFGLEGMPEKQWVQWQTKNGTSGEASSMSAGRDTRRVNTHPTVKPHNLMRYLCRLVTPPEGLVLDPFMGSGSTGRAAVAEGFRFIGIEKEAEYVEIARKRVLPSYNDFFG